MAHPPMQPGWLEQTHRQLALGDFALESGEVIGDIVLSYVVHGSLERRQLPTLRVRSAAVDP